MRSRRTSLVFFAAITLLLLVNYPWVSLFSTPHLLLGMPPLLLYLFGLWLLFIVIVRLIVQPQPELEEEEESGPDPSQREHHDAD
ncbi:MAG TPA: hypothetical protein VIS52_01660 [Motiliproteus sp.]